MLIIHLYTIKILTFFTTIFISTHAFAKEIDINKPLLGGENIRNKKIGSASIGLFYNLYNSFDGQEKEIINNNLGTNLNLRLNITDKIWFNQYFQFSGLLKSSNMLIQEGVKIRVIILNYSLC